MAQSSAKNFYSLIFILLPLTFLWAETGQSGELPRLAVIGVTNGTAEKELSNLLITQGIAQLAAQELYDTGFFVPIEDNPEITGRINELVSLSLHSGAEELDPDRLFSTGRELGCQSVATVKITQLNKSRSRVGFGPFSSAKVKVKIEVEVSLKNDENPLISARGIGSGITRSKSFLFLVRKDKVSFDKTSVGRATQEAVRKAVLNLTSIL
ncbi:MAG: hypothetical protein ABFS18_01705 [Thermodesulfobacteriota bacterium]